MDACVRLYPRDVRVFDQRAGYLISSCMMACQLFWKNRVASVEARGIQGRKKGRKVSAAPAFLVFQRLFTGSRNAPVPKIDCSLAPLTVTALGKYSELPMAVKQSFAGESVIMIRIGSSTIHDR
jgi:hypothetical protein